MSSVVFPNLAHNLTSTVTKNLHSSVANANTFTINEYNKKHNIQTFLFFFLTIYCKFQPSTLCGITIVYLIIAPEGRHFRGICDRNHFNGHVRRVKRRVSRKCTAKVFLLPFVDSLSSTPTITRSACADSQNHGLLTTNCVAYRSRVFVIYH